MSCLLNAITTKSRLEDVVGRMEPDNNSGFETGTWTFPKYLCYFEDIAGENCTTKEDFEGLYNPIQVYTSEAHKKIVRALKALLKTLPEGEIDNSLISDQEMKILKEWCGVGRQPVYPRRNPLQLNHRKWYERLLEIFESKEAVIYSI